MKRSALRTSSKTATKSCGQPALRPRIANIIRAAEKCDAAMPWSRGARRAAMISRRTARLSNG